MARKPRDKKQEAEIADDVLIREVDDDLRAEKLQAWWQKFGSILVGACVVVVLATIGYQIASSYRTSQSEEATAILLQAQSAVDKGQTDTAIKELTPLTDDSSKVSELAKLQAANLKNETTLFDKLAKEAKTPAIADAAHLQTATDSTKADSIFYPLEAERKAVKLLGEDKKAEARTLLLALLDRTDIPSAQRQRLNELLQGAN